MSLPASILPQKLREYLTARECVAFVGAGFSMPCGMPGWGNLLAELLKEAAKSVTTTADEAALSECRGALTNGQYPTAASGIKKLLSKEELRKCLIDAFDSSRLQRLTHEKQERMLSRMENLVRGPWAGFITTNFDMLIENAFDRFPQGASPFCCYGAHDSLGNILCIPVGAGRFFAKLHGDTWANSPVLSTADYVQAWLSSSQICDFVTAVMLRYRLVFIGCSLEDTILRLRLRLWADFGKALPRAYALLPDTDANRFRRQELKDEAGLESLLYPVGKSGDGHEAVDEFLSVTRHCADVSRSDLRNFTPSAIRVCSIAERLVTIGAINRHLLAVLSRQSSGRLEYRHIFDPHFEQVPQDNSRHVLSTLSEEERLHRFFFLLLLSLVGEHAEDGIVYFQLTPELRAHLLHSPLSEGT